MLSRTGHRETDALFCLQEIMAREFAGNFYKTAAWVAVRNEYARRAGHLCERCMSRGLIRPGEIVHHKIFLDESNINNPEVTLNMDNLELLCRECHAEIHDKAKGKRYKVLEDGTVKIL